MKSLLIITSVLVSTILFGQKYPFHENHTLEKSTSLSPEKTHIDDIYYYNKYTLAIEYEYDYNYGQFYKYYTEHYRVKLATDLAIEEFNKVYISLEDVVLLKNVEARVIKADKVVDLDPEVEEFYSADEDNQYLYFPVSGLEKGDELEILYTVKMEPEYEGDQFFFQGEIPIYDFEFYFISGVDSKFDFKSHNGLPDAALVDTILHRNQWTIALDSIPAMEMEYFQEYNNSIMKLDVALTAFVDGTEEDFSPYQNFANLLNSVYNNSYKGKDAKKIHALNQELGIFQMRSTKEKIRTIENFMKEDFDMFAGSTDGSMANVIDNRRGGVIDGMNLYIALFEDAQIAYEYGFISDRYETQFDPDIESTHFLQNYFFYFPDVNAYLAPIDMSSRMGFMNDDWVPNYGFHVRHKKFPMEAKFDVKKIPNTEAKNSTDSLVINIELAANLVDLEITVERYVKGYFVGKNQLYYSIYREQKRKEIEDDLINFIHDRSQVKLTSLENMNTESAFDKTVIAKGKFVDLATPLIEKAGDITIFKLGEVFGEYADLIEIYKKQTDFVFGKAFIRSTTVNFNYPQGMKISNKEDLITVENVSSHEDVHIGGVYSFGTNSVTFKLEERWLSTRYSIDRKEEMFDIFEFYASISTLNVILE